LALFFIDAMEQIWYSQIKEGIFTWDGVLQMRFFKLFSERVRKLNHFSRIAIKLSFYIMICIYITAGFAFYIAPYMPSYLRAMTVYYGAMEVAPACLAAGICAALLCDIIYHSCKSNDNDSDKKDS